MSKDKKEQQKKGRLDLHLNQLADSSHSALVYKSADTLKLIDRQRQLHEETDEAFVKSVNKIMRYRQNEYIKLLKNGKDQMTVKQCQQLHFRAKIHGKANTINQNSHLDFKEINELDKCRCGCKKGKGKYISFCINDQKLKILGPGVLLQLLFQKASAAIVLTIIVIYCIFAITTNYMGGQAIINEQCRQDLYCKFKQYSSNENKDTNSNYRTIQNWLGVVFCLIWIFALKVIRYVGKQKNLIIDEKLKSAADCAIKVQNLPRGTYQQQELIGYIEGVWQKKLQKYFAQKSMGAKNISQLKIQQNKKYKLKFKSIQIIYNMEFARRMINQILYLTHKIDSLWMKSKINGTERTVVRNKHQYKYTKVQLIQSYELLEDLRKRFLNDSQFRKLISTTCCIIQFESQKKRRAVLKFIGQQKVGFFKQLCLKLKNFFNSSTRSTLFHHKILRIQRAPEPSDILWENCEKPESVLRKLGIFLATFCVMGVAFGIIFALTYFQEDVKLNPNKYDPAIETVVNNFIGIVLQIINAILWKVTSFLLDFQYNHTQTQKITSLMIRILILNSINVIALPIFSNYIVYEKEGIYGNNGLTGVIFDYHTSAILAAVKGLFNITAILKTIGTAIRWIRHKIIWFLITDPINIDFKKGDPNVNKFYQGIDYDIAQSYMFIIIAILHASFFCHLQPFIVIILFIMIIIFYLVTRVKLLYLCKMPGMTQYLVFDLAIWMLGFVPIYYSVGTIYLSYAQNQQKQAYPFSLYLCIPAIICGVIGIFGLLNPLGILNKLTFWLTNKIIGNIDDPEQYEMDEDDFIEDQEVSQCQFMVQETKIKQTQNSTRVQSYYDESNSLILLGFEKLLKNQKIIQMRTELKHYCQSFFPKQLSHRQIIKQIIQQNVPQKQKIFRQQNSLNSLNQLNIQNEANQIKIKPRKRNKYKDDDYEESPSQNR